MTPREAFESQAISCATLGSPFMERLMTLCADRLTDDTGVGHRVLNWAGNPHSSADSVPLRLAGGLHRLALSGAAPELAAHYPPNQVDDDALWDAVIDALVAHQDALLVSLQSAPQTNEVRRSVALIPAFHLIARETGLPLWLSELGASAGLNLHNDSFRLIAGATNYGPPDAIVTLHPDWQGPAPEPAQLSVADRAGVDLRPFDLTDADQKLRLLSYLWPDQPERAAITRAAIDLSLADPPALSAGDAIDWLETRLTAQPEGTAHVVHNTVAWQYFPAEAQARGRDLLNAAGKQATPERPLAHVAVEADGGRGAGLTLQTWPGGDIRPLARVDFHGRWIEWTAT